uniref:Cytochrome P450 n=1 Tax=Nothapodytes nimmoniana TaxID=159386 RepID=A0A7L7RBC5_NOTNI|nr:cytochrome P450 [Nothapodytes nimmoniana]
MFFALLLPLFIFITFLVIWFCATYSKNNQKQYPPSPPKLPLIGNLHQLGLLPHRTLHSLAQQHGSLMLLHLGSQPVLVASSAREAREIMKTHDLIFSNRPRLNIPRRLLYDSKEIAFAPYSEYWRQIKSLCVLHLLSNRRVHSFQSVREEETTLMIERIRESCLSDSSPSSLVNLSEEFMSLTNDIVCRIALGRTYGRGDGGRKFKKLFGDFAQLLGVFDVGDYIPSLAWVNRFNGLDAKVNTVAKEIDELLEVVVEDHMDHRNRDGKIESGKQDFVDILLDIQDEKKTGFNFHRDTTKAIILDVFAAGTHTTSTVIDWAMAELLKHPKILKKLQNEVREIAKGKSRIKEDELDKMHYVKAVIKETMRLHPPVPLLVPRESTQDVKVLGYDIQAKTQVIVNAWAIGRDPLLWQEPEEFQPDRFLNSPIDFKGFHFELIPFGSGRRACPGITFAMDINELVLTNLVNNFDFALPGGRRGEDLDMVEAPGLTVHKKSPLLVVATPYCQDLLS